MKINLLTIHYGKSYGAVMQTYATCKLLERAGHDVCVINLIHPKTKNIYNKLTNYRYIVKEFQFWYFKHKYFPKLTKKFYKIEIDNLPEADIYIVGSDQVWNRDITGIWGLNFFLDFVSDKYKRIALSSSFGKYNWTEDNAYTQSVTNELKQFNKISVREDSGVKILQKIFNINATTLIDPTLAYEEICDLAYKRKSPKQIYAFLLNNSDEEKTIVNEISKTYGIGIRKNKLLDKYLFSGPRDWLTKIQNAEYIITDSFHGLAFSIIFKKNFFILCANKNKFTRIDSLLKLLNLSDRYIHSIEDFRKRSMQLKQNIDYLKVDKILTEERRKFNQFVSSI